MEKGALNEEISHPAVTEVQRRIGRNVLLFQRIEYLLKHLNAHAAFGGTVSTLQDAIERNARAIHRKTMGELAGQLVDNFLATEREESEPQDDLDEIWMGTRVSIVLDAELLESHKSEMKALVEARNDLIHHFLERLPPPTEDNLDEFLDYLDEQRVAGHRVMRRLEEWARLIDEERKRWADYLASPEWQQQFELGFLLSTPLVTMLGQIAMSTSRKDGWTLLSTAGSIIKRDAPRELMNLRERFGQSSLKGVLLAAQVFDVQEEPTSGGGTRTIYRINSRCELQISSSE